MQNLSTRRHLPSAPNVSSSLHPLSLHLQTPNFLAIRPIPATKVPTCVKALREWLEYEDAVRDKDLARALQYLKSVQLNETSSSSSISPSSSHAERWLRLDRDWEVLDTCLNADDMRLVGSAYKFLQDRGFLENFGKYSNIVLEGRRDVSPTVLKELTGLEASKLSQKK